MMIRILCRWLQRHRWEFQYRNPRGGRWWWRYDRCQRCGEWVISQERI